MGLLRVDRICGPPRPLVRDGVVLARRCHVARGPLTRLVGLLGTPDLRPDEALWITRCADVHAIGLRAAIGVAFVDGDGVVLAVADPLPRGRTASRRGARAVVECAAGVLAGVRPGDRLALRPAGERDVVSRGGEEIAAPRVHITTARNGRATDGRAGG